MQPRIDAAVIGSGPNGLSAAIVLARAGWSVTVFEAEERIGGGARSAELTLPGFVHDLCSAFHPMAAASPFLRELPLTKHGLAWLYPEVDCAHPLDDDTAAYLVRSVQETTRSFNNRCGADRYRRLMDFLVSHWDKLLEDVLAPPHVPRHPLVLGRFGLHCLKGGVGVARTLGGFGGRALFAGIAAHAIMPLETIPPAALGLMLMLAGHAVGWPIPRGGSQRVSDALAAHLRELGGTIVSGKRVERLDDLPPARAYLFDVTPRQLLEIAGDHLPESYRRKLSRYRHGPGVFKVDWALAGPAPWRAGACRKAGVVHVGGTLLEIAAAERMVWNGEHPERPFILFGQQSVVDPGRAPPGRHTGWGYCHVPNGSTVDMTERIERQIDRFAPGFRDLILARVTHNSSQMQARNANLVGGDIAGGAMTLRQIVARPILSTNPYATPNPRIWLCSSSTPPGAGVHGMCGYHAARAVLRKL